MILKFEDVEKGIMMPEKRCLFSNDPWPVSPSAD
jgi:hypothetical protein